MAHREGPILAIGTIVMTEYGSGRVHSVLDDPSYRTYVVAFGDGLCRHLSRDNIDVYNDRRCMDEVEPLALDTHVRWCGGRMYRVVALRCHYGMLTGGRMFSYDLQRLEDGVILRDQPRWTLSDIRPPDKEVFDGVTMVTDGLMFTT